MITKIELTQDDIIGIIADHFNVQTEDISIVVVDGVRRSYVVDTTRGPEVNAVIFTSKRSWGWKK